MSDLIATAKAWIAGDPDPATQQELRDLISAGDHAELARRFTGPLAFGTAGLRGKVEAGESRMNQATVTRTSAGLAKYLNQRVTTPKVVVGCDARHGSAQFHAATCETLAAAGCDVIALPPQLPTPITAFATRHFNADAGVMITASHNPPQDNGYKVYLGGRLVSDDAATGVQLISPADHDITTCINTTPDANQIPRSAEGITWVDDDIVTKYLQQTIGHLPPQTGTDADMPIVITAMHGVGGAVVTQALNKAGFSTIIPVAQQIHPDPDFPTVDFPNPEEKGAMELAYLTADSHDAELILALDPDADRCSVAIKETGGWRQLTGDEVGAILGESIARENTGSGQTLACSIVSSRLLSEIAKRHGLEYAATLTGFKWIARTPNLLFGYEEALGYCCDPAAVRDKDGITASVKIALIAAGLRRKARSLSDFLAEIDDTYGVYATSPLTFRMDTPEAITQALERLSSQPPSQLAGAAVCECVDLAAGFAGLPPTTGLWLKTQANDRIVVRPSGTEPKLKCYLEVVTTERAVATDRLAQLQIELAKALGLAG
ncbi:phosphomannomutase [Corynebacterium mustelae]|uniref:Phosphomannomutase n=1 Tax=Corynebacterium mustelae TaxID=571915 RepID=A0A0G3H550_9CORY|nr:phospho-sugar mutase [Corynebacterium mustelae]AKK06958.1 phosphomannomutase [Corynebacterium mustelae]